MINLPFLPIHSIFDALEKCMKKHNRAIIIAPPGAGKTTLIPLFLQDKITNGKDKKIIVLEPRRLAARAAARHMAHLLNQDVGEQIGYIMRDDQKISDQTRIIIVTEGVFVRMLLDDPELNGIAAVIFDEFHERNIDADFGLALAIDVQNALRADLKIIVMSATLDGAKVADLLNDATILKSQGRSYNVDIRYSHKPHDERIEDTMCRTIMKTLREENGSILAFLPGQAEIERTEKKLVTFLGNLPIIKEENIIITPLYGTLDMKEQDSAILPSPKNTRKIVLATSIAESSITIEGVRIVIDSGLARVPIFKAANAITHLETVRVSRASADQRAGRAGRTEDGIAIRLWLEGQNAALPQFATPQIMSSDLSNLLLNSIAFGVQDPTSLHFLNPPPLSALKEARELLLRLAAIDKDGHLTTMGKAMQKLSLPVRFSHMVIKAAEFGQAYAAAELALLLSERGFGDSSIEINEKLRIFKQNKSKRAQNLKKIAKSIAYQAEKFVSKPTNALPYNDLTLPARLLIEAWPDRIAKARDKKGHFLLANGRGAIINANDPLASSTWLIVTDLSGGAEQSRIFAATNIDEDMIRALQSHTIKQETQLDFNSQSQSLRATQKEYLGAILLSTKNLPPPRNEEANQKWLEIIREHGLSILPWHKEAQQVLQRLFWLHKGLGDPWPNVNEDTLLEQLEQWLLPFLPGKADLSAITSKILIDGLHSLIPYHLQRDFNILAPTHFIAPTGSKITIDYDGNEPTIALRVQELYGMTTHPSIAHNKIPLIIELLSPAHRPIQITRDLPSFWSGSWKDVRNDMRGRYPKHLWPENPQEAIPTTKTKPRKN